MSKIDDINILEPDTDEEGEEEEYYEDEDY